MTKPDHRKAVAAQRRHRMHQRLVEATILMVAARGPDATAIEDVVREAGVARGTFYKYFASIDQALFEAKMRLGTEVLELVLACQPPAQDPAEGMARAILRVFATFHRYPLLGEFSTRTGMQALSVQGAGMDIMEEMILPLLEEGMQQGRFIRMPLPMALDFLHSGVVLSFWRTLGGHPPDEAQTTAALLRLLGVPPEDAHALSVMEVPPIEAPEGSMIDRAEKIRISRLAGTPRA